MLGFLHCLDSLPLESHTDPVVYSGTQTGTPPHREQICPVMSCEDASVPQSHIPTSGEPHSGHSISQASRVPGATSQLLSQSSSGVSQPLNTSSVVPSEQRRSTPDTSVPSEMSRLQMESPAHTRNEGVNQIADETLLEEVDPEKGPMTGGIRIALFGENFPAIPLYVGFGDNWVRAVSYVQLHYPLDLIPKYVIEAARCPYSAMPSPTINPSRYRERYNLSNTLQKCA